MDPILTRRLSGRIAAGIQWRIDKRSDPMWRILAVLTLLLSGALVASGSWMLFRPSVTPFLVRGATNIQVVSTGVWEWQIAYDAPGPAYAWYFTLSRTIEAQQWDAHSLWRLDGSPVTTLGFVPGYVRGYAGVLREEVMLTPNYRHPQHATITLRQHLRIPWWPYWSPTG
jgi:hypothetical protein